VLKGAEGQELEWLWTRFAEDDGPVSFRLHWRNWSELAAVRARTALGRLNFPGILADFG